jgi:hypothetical protein
MTPKEKIEVANMCAKLLKYERDRVERKFAKGVLEDIQGDDELYPSRADVARVKQRYKRIEEAEKVRDQYWMFLEGY